MTHLFGAFAILLALGLGSQNQAQADPIDDALTLWLAGEEEASLNALSAFAGGQDPKAQLALGLIDAEPLYHGPWLLSRDRQVRIALLRQAGGLSGRNWMWGLDQDPAPLWRSAWDGDAKAHLVQDFLSIGEDRAALIVALRLANRQKRGFDRLTLDEDSPNWLHLLAQRDLADAGKGPVILPADLHTGDPAAHHILGGPLPDDNALAAWLTLDPMAAPIRTYCQTLCPAAATGTCHLGLFQAIGGYPALVRIRAPSPNLIAEDRFAASPVAHRMLVQLVADKNENARRKASDGPICSG